MRCGGFPGMGSSCQWLGSVCREKGQMRPGQLPRLSGNLPGEEPESCSRKRDQQGSWDCGRHRASEEVAGSSQRKVEDFQRHLEAPNLCTRYLLGCVWLRCEKPVAAG